MAEMTYAKAGVDFRKEELVIKGISNWISKTHEFRKGLSGEVMDLPGAYANLLDLGTFALAFTTDGVGSKVLVAQELRKFDTIGIDLMAMNVNDLLCVGAEPIALVDYLALQEANHELAREISIGLYEGAKQARVAIVGGETASLPDIIAGLDNMGFDLAGSAIGVVSKDKIIDGRDIKVGDTILGFGSNGVHSNGLTLARKVLPKSLWIQLLKPTKIYVTEVLNILSKFQVHGLAHITGGGFTNIERLTKHGVLLDDLPEPDMIFKKIAEEGNISEPEMHRTFNMGVGFIVIADPSEAEKILSDCGQEYGMKKIGEITSERGVKIVRKESTFTL